MQIARNVRFLVLCVALGQSNAVQPVTAPVKVAGGAAATAVVGGLIAEYFAAKKRKEVRSLRTKKARAQAKKLHAVRNVLLGLGGGIGTLAILAALHQRRNALVKTPEPDVPPVLATSVRVPEATLQQLINGDTATVQTFEQSEAVRKLQLPKAELQPGMKWGVPIQNKAGENLFLVCPESSHQCSIWKKDENGTLRRVKSSPSAPPTSTGLPPMPPLPGGAGAVPEDEDPYSSPFASDTDVSDADTYSMSDFEDEESDFEDEESTTGTVQQLVGGGKRTQVPVRGTVPAAPSVFSVGPERPVAGVAGTQQQRSQEKKPSRTQGGRQPGTSYARVASGDARRAVHVPSVVAATPVALPPSSVVSKKVQRSRESGAPRRPLSAYPVVAPRTISNSFAALEDMGDELDQQKGDHGAAPGIGILRGRPRRQLKIKLMSKEQLDKKRSKVQQPVQIQPAGAAALQSLAPADVAPGAGAAGSGTAAAAGAGSDADVAPGRPVVPGVLSLEGPDGSPVNLPFEVIDNKACFKEDDVEALRKYRNEAVFGLLGGEQPGGEQLGGEQPGGEKPAPAQTSLQVRNAWLSLHTAFTGVEKNTMVPLVLSDSDQGLDTTWLVFFKKPEETTYHCRMVKVVGKGVETLFFQGNEAGLGLLQSLGAIKIANKS